MKNEEECNEVIQLGEDFGINTPSADVGTLRTVNRTSNYLNKDVSGRIGITKISDFNSILKAKSDKETMHIMMALNFMD